MSVVNVTTRFLNIQLYIYVIIISYCYIYHRLLSSPQMATLDI